MEISSMEIKSSEDLQIKYKDRVLKITRPKVGYLRDFKKRLKNSSNPDSSESDVDVMFDYCLHVGVPEEVLNEWGLKQMTQLFTHMNEDEKKS